MSSATDLDTRILLRSEETGGQVSVVEILVPPRCGGPPLHRHDFEEAFYVAEGELVFRVGETLATRRAGELEFAPRNVVHALANQSDAPARYVLVCTPGGFERHWARRTAAAAGREPPEWARQPIPEVITVGPPIGTQPGESG